VATIPPNFLHLFSKKQKPYMKKFILFFAMLAGFTSYAQPSHPNSPHDTLSNAHATVTYGRPSKKGREVFGGLEKYGSVWRVGADEATTITFKSDVKFNGEAVKAGTYTLFAKLGEKEWTIILNSKLGQWGAFSYEKNKAMDVAQTTVPVTKLDHVVEQLTLSFGKDNSLVIAWDQTQVTIPLSF